MAQGTIARRPVGQQTAYLRKRVFGAVASGGGNGTYTVGWIPAGANVVRINTSTRTAFSGGAPAATIGSAASPANLVAAAGPGLIAIGFTNQTVVAANLGAVVDVDTQVVIVISGTPTAGVSDVQVEYTVPDETP